MNTPEINKDLWSPTRFRITSYLYQVTAADFPTLQEVTQTSKSDLSRNIKQLSDGGYLKVKKQRKGRYGATIVYLTEYGNSEYSKLLKSLKQITAL